MHYWTTKVKKKIKKYFLIFLLTGAAHGCMMDTSNKEHTERQTMNTALFKTMIDRYNAASFTHEYIFGYTDRGNVYVTFAKSDILPYVCKLDNASRGCGYALRFVPTKAQKEILKMEDTFILCSKAMFEYEVANSKYNRGEIFEKMVTEYFGQIWVKDNVPFTADGDLTINGIAYQIKYQAATFCNEKSLNNLC